MGLLRVFVVPFSAHVVQAAVHVALTLPPTPFRTLIYLTLFIGTCMKACERIDSKSEAKSALYQTAIKSFTIPGDTGWSLGSLFPSPKGREESDTFKAYFKQARQEVAERVLDKIYDAEGKKNKWWFCFAKRKFMGKELRA